MLHTLHDIYKRDFYEHTISVLQTMIPLLSQDKKTRPAHTSSRIILRRIASWVKVVSPVLAAKKKSFNTRRR
jgi:hypothetical protein